MIFLSRGPRRGARSLQLAAAQACSESCTLRAVQAARHSERDPTPRCKPRGPPGAPPPPRLLPRRGPRRSRDPSCSRWGRRAQLGGGLARPGRAEQAGARRAPGRVWASRLPPRPLARSQALPRRWDPWRAAGGHGRRRRAGRRLVRTRGAAGRRGGPQARGEPGTRSPSGARAGPGSKWRRRRGRREGCCSGFCHRTPSSGPPREAAGAAGAPPRGLRPAAGSGATGPHALLGCVLSVWFLAGTASPGAGAWRPAADRAPPPHNKARATPARRRLYDGLDATQMGTCWRKCLSHFIRPEAGFLLPLPHSPPHPRSHPSG